MSWRIVPLLMLVVALAHFNRIAISVAGAERIIRPGFVSETEMGFVYSSFLVVYTICMIPGGWFIDRFGPRAGWLVLGFGSAAGVALTGVVGMAFTTAAPLLLGLITVRALTGMVSAPLHPSGARLVSNWVPPQGVALANGLVTFAACVGMASTYVVFGMLMDLLGWPQAFLAVSGVTLLVGVLWYLLATNYPPEIAARAKALLTHEPSVRRERDSRIEAAKTDSPVSLPPPEREQSITEQGSSAESFPREDEKPSELGRFLSLLGNPSLICLTLSYGAVGYFEYLFYYWAQFYFEKVLMLPKDVSRANSSVLLLAMGAGMVAGGWLSDRALARFGFRRGLAIVPVAGFLLGALATVAGLARTSVAEILLCFAVAMAAIGACEGPFWTAAIRIGSARGGTAAAILNTGGNAVGLLAPVVTPALAEYFGWQVGLALASIVCVLGAALWWGVALSDDIDDSLPAPTPYDGPQPL
jgi:MFS family permease